MDSLPADSRNTSGVHRTPTTPLHQVTRPYPAPSISRENSFSPSTGFGFTSGQDDISSTGEHPQATMTTTATQARSTNDMNATYFGPDQYGMAYHPQDGTSPYGASRERAHFVDSMINNLGGEGLSAKSRLLLHSSVEIDLTRQTALVLIESELLRQEVRELRDKIESQDKTLRDLTAYCRSSWGMDDMQKELVRTATRHFMTRATLKYGKETVSAVISYARRCPAKFHFNNTLMNDPIVISTLSKFVGQYEHSQRGNLRKLVWSSIENNESLDCFYQRVTAKWQMGKIPAPTDRSGEAMMGQFALMRHVALPLINVTRDKGADTGFWKAMNRELKAKSHKRALGTERKKGASWIEFDKKMIADDIKKYGRGCAGKGDFENTDEEEYDELNGEDTSLVQYMLAAPQTSNTVDDPED